MWPYLTTDEQRGELGNFALDNDLIFQASLRDGYLV